MTITPATHAISINPATGEQLSVLPWAGANDIENALQLAAAGFRDWRETNIDYRAEKLRDIGKALRARSEEMAQMITREMGKPINQARAEVAKSANLCDWYAEHGPAMLKAEPTLVENQQAVIEYRPLGTILAIMPWNFPLWQVMRGAVPIILAGNGYLLKHAPNVMGCAQLIAQVFKDAGIPQGVYGWLNADNDGVTQMIKDSRIAAITVTGSVRAGAAIGAQAGAALKKCVLELGGSDPFIVLNDADLELAVKAAVAGRYQNTGQVCAAAKRFIIEEGIASAFTERFVAAAAALKMGDPRDEENALGPMARFDLRDELHHQVEEIKSAVRFLLLHAAQFSIDTNRIFIWGEKRGADLSGITLLTANDPEWNAEDPRVLPLRFRAGFLFGASDYAKLTAMMPSHKRPALFVYNGEFDSIDEACRAQFIDAYHLQNEIQDFILKNTTSGTNAFYTPYMLTIIEKQIQKYL